MQNKNVMSQYRAVGHPVAFTVTEALVDKAAAALGLDPAELRARNYVSDDAYPYQSASGFTYEGLSLQRSLEKLKEMIDYPGLREEQKALREKGVHRGIGIATFVEITAPGPAFYGVGGARISSQDGCSMKLEPSGKVQLAVSVNELGQGTETIVAQIAATELGITMEDIRVVTGDTGTTPYGGAAWASRAAAIGGEATLRAARALRDNILEVAGAALGQPRRNSICAMAWWSAARTVNSGSASPRWAGSPTSAAIPCPRDSSPSSRWCATTRPRACPLPSPTACTRPMWKWTRTPAWCGC